ncbi:gamma-glutamyltransferase family protein [Pseudohalocynthiibacter sp. F2068]|uniref:gamma-glutamyltransferase family protein n=1 Tax=Pseudohalocynthiibacter sp. F2068 TaxID=2926418 RepID=UPI001FF3A2DE|nr:gamma-glutamyltransferase family protein [Pseudohalocynthiibacter sp. F2068]MCK0103163.1 gamma-glutamyltransferase family protein [Pseudohalocynthiibacter sp. F2068]
MRDFQQPGRSLVYATNGMCATSHPLAAKVAVQMLESGGNAVDAAIAAAVLLGICEPQMTGIGGDCFVLLKPPGSEDIIALNGSGRAPAGLSSAELREQGNKVVPVGGANSVTVPGAVDAFCRLSKDWGKLGLKAALAPAIYYADAGIPVAPRVAFDWAEAVGNLTGTARKDFLLNGKAPIPGQVFRVPKQAEALRHIAAEGRAGFYQGAIAEDMVKALKAEGGKHTLDDFAATACDYTDPVSGLYKGTELVEHPPNGQGATAILMANMLAHFDIADMDPLGSKRAHIEAEISKLAYDTRNRFIADADHMMRTEYMIAPETAANLAALVDPKRAIESATRLSEQVHKDTIYLTVVDKDQMVVSLIYSIFASFGSGLSSDKFGILFQNRGSGFTLETGHPNEAGGGKRPMHTIIPGMLRKDGRVTMPFGVMGGQYQSCGHARFLSNLVDFGMDAQTAIDTPRCFSEDGNMKVERGYSDKVRQELTDLGHSVSIPPGPIGGAQAILIDRETGTLQGASDPRKDGCALGY